MGERFPRYAIALTPNPLPCTPMGTDVPAADQDALDPDSGSAVGPPLDAASANQTPKGLRRNFALGVLAGMIGETARDFIQPQLILAGFFVALVGGADRFWYLFLVAMLTVVEKGAALGPQLLVGSRFEHLPRKRPVFIALSVARVAATVAMVASLWLLTKEASPATYALFYVVLFLSYAIGGSLHITFLDMVGRMIPSRRIGLYLGMRNFLGGAVSVVAGTLVIQPILSFIGQPGGYVLLAVIGSVLIAVDLALFAMCREGTGPSAKRRTTLGESLRRGLRWLRLDRSYRAYLWTRIAFRINILTWAFFIPYGEERLAHAGGAVGVALLGGILVATFKLSRVAMSAVWASVADRHGYRACLVGSGVCFFLSPVAALVAPALPTGFEAGIPWTKAVLDLPLLVYLVSLAFFGAALQGSMIGGNRFLVTCAPPHRRPSYIGFLNTVTSPLTLLPLAAVAVAYYWGMGVLFAALLAGGVIYAVAASRMAPDPRVGPDADEPGPPVSPDQPG